MLNKIKIKRMKKDKYVCWEPLGERGDNVKTFTNLNEMNEYLNDAIRAGRIISVRANK